MSIQSSPLFPLRLDSLSSGLKTEPLTGGVFRRLNIVGCAFNFAELRVCPLQHISVLRLFDCHIQIADLVYLAEFIIPEMKCLNKLDLEKTNCNQPKPNLFQFLFAHLLCRDDGVDVKPSTELLDIYANPAGKEQDEQDGLLKVLQQLIHSNVTSLNVVETGFTNLVLQSPQDYYSALSGLMDPIDGNLQEFCYGNSLISGESDVLYLLLKHSSVKHLLIFGSSIHLESNTCLTKLTIIVDSDLSWLTPDRLPNIIKVIKYNKMLQHLVLATFDLTESEGIGVVRDIVNALCVNNTLSSVRLGIIGPGCRRFCTAFEYVRHNFEELTHDSRISWYIPESLPKLYNILDIKKLLFKM